MDVHNRTSPEDARNPRDAFAPNDGPAPYRSHRQVADLRRHVTYTPCGRRSDTAAPAVFELPPTNSDPRDTAAENGRIKRPQAQLHAPPGLHFPYSGTGRWNTRPIERSCRHTTDIRGEFIESRESLSM
ncbi:hypothetical protein GCM10020220_046250 [Nonomuraea rubra]